jgi:hypothetical protein
MGHAIALPGSARHLGSDALLWAAQGIGRRDSHALLCVFDLRQYEIFFVQGGLYELVTGGLLHALRILK